MTCALRLRLIRFLGAAHGSQDDDTNRGSHSRMPGRGQVCPHGSDLRLQSGDPDICQCDRAGHDQRQRVVFMRIVAPRWRPHAGGRRQKGLDPGSGQSYPTRYILACMHADTHIQHRGEGARARTKFDGSVHRRVLDLLVLAEEPAHTQYAEYVRDVYTEPL